MVPSRLVPPSLAAALLAWAAFGGVAAAQQHAPAAMAPMAMGEDAASVASIAATYGPLAPFLVDYAAMWRRWSDGERTAYVEGFRGAIAATAEWHWQDALAHADYPDLERYAIDYRSRYFRLLENPLEPIAAAVGALYRDPANAIVPVGVMVDVAVAAAGGTDPAPRLAVVRDRLLADAHHMYDHGHL